MIIIRNGVGGIIIRKEWGTAPTPPSGDDEWINPETGQSWINPETGQPWINPE